MVRDEAMIMTKVPAEWGELVAVLGVVCKQRTKRR